MRNYCHFCTYCLGYCTIQPDRFSYSGYKSNFPVDHCNNFKPDYDRSDATSKDDFDRACATCRFYTASCNIYEKICDNSTRICDMFEFYHDND